MRTVKDFLWSICEADIALTGSTVSFDHVRHIGPQGLALVHPATAIGCRLWPSADGARTIAGGTARRQARRQARPARGPGPDDLLADVRQRLASGEPVDLLAYVSTLLAAVDPRGQNPFERERAGGPERATLPTLLESFAEVVLPETTALLAALAELGPDELTRARARRALAARPHPLPDWLARLGETSVYRAVESTHVLGDGDSVLLGARLPGHELTAVIYIDHNLGTVVKDAFPAPGPISEVIERMREAADDPDVRSATSALPTRGPGLPRRSRWARSCSRRWRRRPGRRRGR